jgi:drug/metabolite transporter (DMT)-like permease
MIPKSKLVELHVIVLLWGFTPILGKLISFGALDLVWYRLVFALGSLYLLMVIRGKSLKLEWKHMLHFMLIGSVVGLHWYYFYHSIKVSNVSVTMAGFSTLTLFASVMQPLLLKEKFFWGDLFYGLLLLAGLGIIFKFETQHIPGLIFGILAAFTGAFFGVYNGRLIPQHNAYKITFYEFAGALVVISIARLFTSDDVSSYIPALSMSDTVFVLLLSVLCTSVAFTWSIEILKVFTPLTVIITNNLEPVYGIVFSVILFGDTEYMSTGFYIGAAIILVSVFTYPLIKSRITVNRNSSLVKQG